MIPLFSKAFSNFQFRSIFLRSLLLLNIIAVMPILAVGLLGNWFSQKAIHDEVGKSSLQMLEQTERLMEVLLNQLDNQSIQIANSQALSDILKKPEFDPSSQAVSKIHDSLLDLYISSPYIDSVYIYYRKAGMVQGPLLGVNPLRNFSDTGWLADFNSMKKKGIWIVRKSSSPLNQGNHVQVTLIRPFPLTGKQNEGAVIVNLNQMAFFQSPSFHLMRKGEQIWMVSPDGTTAFNNVSGSEVPKGEFALIKDKLQSSRSHFEQTLNHTRFTFSSLSSPNSGWTYVDLIPSHILYQYNRKVQTFMILIGLLSCLVAMLLIVWITNRIYHPIYALIDAVKRNRQPAQTSEKSEFAYLSSAFEAIASKDKVLEKQIREHLPVLRESYLSHILYTESDDKEERLAKLNYYETDFTPLSCFVCILRIDGYRRFLERYNSHDQSLIRYFIGKFAAETAEEHFNAITVHSESRDIVLICNLRREEEAGMTRATAERMMQVLIGSIRPYLAFTLSIGIGDLCPHIGKIAVSFEQAERMADMRIFEGFEAVLAFWNHPPAYSRDLNIIKQFTQFKYELNRVLQSAESGVVHKVLAHIESFSGKLEGYPPGLIRHGFLDLALAALQKSLDLGTDPKISVEPADVYDQFQKLETVEQMTAEIKQIVLDIHASLKSREHQIHSDTTRKILDYLEENFKREISLNEIADQLHLDPSYVSRLFKQEMKVNFMEYLISLRLQKAKQLLAETSLNVKKIGENVGYVNPHSFIRIFKKYEQMTPGRYRETVNSSRLE